MAPIAATGANEKVQGKGVCTLKRKHMVRVVSAGLVLLMLLTAVAAVPAAPQSERSGAMDGLVNLASPIYGTQLSSDVAGTSSLTTLNDGIISAREGGSYDAGPTSKWSNWPAKGASHITLDFGTAQSVETVKCYALEDIAGGGGCALPSSIAVQYWNGSDWAAVDAVPTSERFENEYTVETYYDGIFCQLYTFTFEAVETTKLRVALENASNSICITELETFGTYKPEKGFNMSFGALEDGEKLPVTVLHEKENASRTLYVRLADTKGTTSEQTILLSAQAAATEAMLDWSTLQAGKVTVTASLQEDYQEEKTYEIVKPISDSVIQEIYEEIKTPYPYGVVLRPGAQGEWDSSLVDSPGVFQIPGDDEYVYMTYVGIGDNFAGYSTGIARSKDMLNWEKIGTVLDNTEEYDTWDGFNVGGYILRDHTWGELPTPHVVSEGEYAGKYVMPYLASDTPGYEQGIKRAGIAFADELFLEDGSLAKWERYPDPVLDAHDGTYPYEKGIIWKMQGVWDPETELYYAFYNAATGPEVMCGVTSEDLIHWERMENNPLLKNDGTSFGNSFNADADVVKIGDYWVMIYFTDSPKGIIDSFAVSTDLQNWTKSYIELTALNSTWANTYAHKPSVVKKNGVVYHYYCAVGTEGRTIAVDTSVDLTILQAAAALLDDETLTEAQREDLTADIVALQTELMKEGGSLAEVERARDTLQNTVALVEAGHTHDYSTWQYDDAQHWKVCSTCSRVDEETRGDHQWKKDESASTASCIQYVCEICGAKKTEEIEAPSTPSAGSYVITVVQADGGEISPASVRVTKGSDKTFTITADAGYRVADVQVDGRSVGAVSRYTFENVTASHTITARFEKEKAGAFTDVQAGSWYDEAVAYVSEHGLMDGVGSGKFNPEGAVTRAMVWTVLARMAGEDTEGGSTWYSKAQEWVMETGVSDGTNPMASITREQLAAMLYRYAGSPAVTGSLSAYPDADEVSNWAVDAMVWATEEGIINGMGGNLSPKTGATRAQLAAMLMRLEQNVL